MTGSATWYLTEMVTYSDGRTRNEALYNVTATNEDDARRLIEDELSRKPHRRAMLERWIANGRPVRQARERRR